MPLRLEEKSKGKPKTALGTDDQVQTQEREEENKPPGSVHVQKSQDLEDLVSGEFVDP